MKTILPFLVVTLLASPAFAQPDLPLEIPGMAVFIPWDEPGERVYGTAVMTVKHDPRCPFCGPIQWSVDLGWIDTVPPLTENEGFTPIWYSGAGAILVALSDGIVAVVPAYRSHADLLGRNRWFDPSRLDQWFATVKRIGEKGHFIDSRN